MTTGSPASQTARIYDSLSGRNRIINGACDIAQRGSVTVTAGGNNYGGPDRFLASNTGAGGSFTQSQGSITYNGVARNAIVQTVNTANTNLTSTNFWYGITQIIEGYNCYDLVNEQISISFIFNTNLTGIYSVALRDGNTTHSYVTSFTAVANTPTRYTFNLPASSSLAVPASIAQGMFLTIGFLNSGTYSTSTTNTWLSGNFVSASGATNWGGASNNFIAATEIQVEQGGFCTPFERRPYGTEIVNCQRYYQTMNGQIIVASTNGNFGGNTTYVYGVQMRTVPTTTATNTNSSGGLTGALAAAPHTNNAFQVWGGSGFSIGAYCFFTMFATAEY